MLEESGDGIGTELGESLARTHRWARLHQGQGCYGAPVIRLPRHVVNRVVTVLPIPCTLADACSPLFIITFSSLSNYRSLCPRLLERVEGRGEQGKQGEDILFFFPLFKDLNEWIDRWIKDWIFLSLFFFTFTLNQIWYKKISRELWN